MIFSPEFRRLCERNECGKYGTCWTCPPGAGSFEALRDRVKQYAAALVLQTVWPLEDSFDIEGMLAAGAKHNEAVRKAVAECKKRLLSDASLPPLVLSAGACERCKICTYPEAPCRFPQEAFLPLEACGIDVAGLAAKAKLPYVNGQNTVTYFAVVFMRGACRI